MPDLPTLKAELYAVATTPFFASCGRVQPGRVPRIPASQDHCVKCRHAVWVADSTRKILANHPGHEIYCNECAPVADRIVTSAEQRADIATVIKGG